MSDLKDFIIENGILKKYVGKGGDVVIPNGVTIINRNAFYMCENVKSVVIPTGVTSIGTEAFYGCSELQNITIPDGITKIGAWAFSFCFGLKSIVIPDSVKSLGNFIFADSELRYLCSKKLKASTWWKNQDIMLPAIMGFLLYHKEFTDKAIIDEYKKHVFSKKKKLLQLIFEDDMVSGVEFYASAGKITDKNFDEEFLLPAQAANAIQCVAFLLEWKENNIPFVAE